MEIFADESIKFAGRIPALQVTTNSKSRAHLTEKKSKENKFSDKHGKCFGMAAQESGMLFTIYGALSEELQRQCQRTLEPASLIYWYFKDLD
jgi:hypothetical protein